MKKLLAIVLSFRFDLLTSITKTPAVPTKRENQTSKSAQFSSAMKTKATPTHTFRALRPQKKPATSAMIRSSTNTTSPRTKSAMKQQSTSRNRAASSSSQTPSVMRITSSAPQKSIPTLFSATQPVKRLQSIPSLTTFSTILTASMKHAMFPASLRA